MKTQVSAVFLTLFIQSWLMPISVASTLPQGWEDRGHFKRGASIEPRMTYFGTQQNFDLNGTRSPLLGNGSVNQIYLDLNASVGLTDSISLFGRLSGLYSNVNSTVFPGGGGTSLGLSDQLVGGAVRFWKGETGSTLSAQADVLFPAYNNSNLRSQGRPYLGDGSIDFSAGGFFDLSLQNQPDSDFFLSLGAALSLRSSGYSSAIPFQVMLKRDPKSGFYFAGGIRGQFSLQTDRTLLAAAQVDQFAGAGGSFVVSAVNPSWYLGEVAAGYDFESGHRLFGRISTPLFGQNSATGLIISSGFRFEIGSQTDSDSPNSTPDRMTVPIRTGQFNRYDLVAEVVSVHDQLYIFKINKGSEDNVEVGQVFDIFRPIQDPVTLKTEEKRVARAKATHIRLKETALTVVEYYSDIWIDQGFVAKRVLR